MAGGLADPDSSRRWRARPLLAALVRVGVVLVPALLAGLASTAASRAMPAPHGLGVVAWWLAFVGAGLVTWLACVRLLDRLLPLAALLELSLLFPDAAPSRFAVLRRSANPRQLERELREAEAGAPDSEPGRRAQAILELIAALSVHDRRTRGHSERVRMFADLLARQMRLSRADADRLRWAALLHDIGKIAVASAILNKPGRPDEAEWEVLHRHPVEGHRMISHLHPWLGAWADAVLDHHERFDGAGYPRGLAGGQISLGGRIVAVADSYETMTAARPYKAAMGVNAARQELVRMSGAQFDPQVVRAFLNISLGRLWWAVGLGALFAEIGMLAPLQVRLAQLGTRALSATTATMVATAALVTGVAALPASPAASSPVATRPAMTALAPPAPLSSPGAVSVPSPEPAPPPATTYAYPRAERPAPPVAAASAPPPPPGAPPPPSPPPSASPCPGGYVSQLTSVTLPERLCRILPAGVARTRPATPAPLPG